MSERKSIRKDKVFKYIRKRCQEGFSPTIREVCNDLSIASPSTVQLYVKELVQEGLILKNDNLTRTLKLPNSQMFKVPIVNGYNPDRDITDSRKIEGYYPIYIKETNLENLFAMRIKNDDFEDMGLYKDDLAIFEKVQTVEEKDLYVIEYKGHLHLVMLLKNSKNQIMPSMKLRKMVSIDYDVCKILGKLKASVHIR